MCARARNPPLVAALDLWPRRRAVSTPEGPFPPCQLLSSPLPEIAATRLRRRLTWRQHLRLFPFFRACVGWKWLIITTQDVAICAALSRPVKLAFHKVCCWQRARRRSALETTRRSGDIEGSAKELMYRWEAGPAGSLRMLVDGNEDLSGKHRD